MKQNDILYRWSQKYVYVLKVNLMVRIRIETNKTLCQHQIDSPYWHDYDYIGIEHAHNAITTKYV